MRKKKVRHCFEINVGYFLELQIRRLSDEDISKADMSSNVLNSMKTQVANGLNQTPEKKLDNNAHPPIEPIENEVTTIRTFIQMLRLETMTLSCSNELPDDANGQRTK